MNSGSTALFLWGKRVVQIIQWLSIYNGPNHSGAGTGAKNVYISELEPEN